MIIHLNLPQPDPNLERLKSSRYPWVLSEDKGGTYLIVDMARAGEFIAQRGALVIMPAYGVRMTAAISLERPDESYRPLYEMIARIVFGGGRLLVNRYEFNETGTNGKGGLYPVYFGSHFGRSPSTRTIHALAVTSKDVWMVRPDAFLGATGGIETTNCLTISSETLPHHSHLVGVAGSLNLLRVTRKKADDLAGLNLPATEHAFLTLRENVIVTVLPPGQAAKFDFGHLVAFPENAYVISGLPSTRYFESPQKVKQYFKEHIRQKQKANRIRRRRQRITQAYARFARKLMTRTLSGRITGTECKSALRHVRCLANGKVKTLIHGPKPKKTDVNGHPYFYDKEHLHDTPQEAFRRYAETLTGPIKSKGNFATNLVFSWRLMRSASTLRAHFTNKGVQVTKRGVVSIFLDYHIARIGAHIMTSKYMRLLNDYSSGEGPVQTLVYNPTDKPMTIVLQSAAEIPSIGSGIIGAIATTPSKLVKIGNGILRGLMTVIR